MERGLVDHIGNVRAGEAGGEEGQPLAVLALVLLQHHRPQVLPLVVHIRRLVVSRSVALIVQSLTRSVVSRSVVSRSVVAPK